MIYLTGESDLHSIKKAYSSLYYILNVKNHHMCWNGGGKCTFFKLTMKKRLKLHMQSAQSENRVITEGWARVGTLWKE